MPNIEPDAHQYPQQLRGSDLPKRLPFCFSADYIPDRLCLPQAAGPEELHQDHGCCTPEDECDLRSQYSLRPPSRISSLPRTAIVSKLFDPWRTSTKNLFYGTYG